MISILIFFLRLPENQKTYAPARGATLRWSKGHQAAASEGDFEGIQREAGVC